MLYSLLIYKICSTLQVEEAPPSPSQVTLTYETNCNESINEAVVDQMTLLPGLTRETILQSVGEQRFDHISAIYDLLTVREDESRGQSPVSPFIFPTQRKASITTGVVERTEAPPEIQLYLNDSQIYEKVSDVKNYGWLIHLLLRLFVSPRTFSLKSVS